MATKKPTAAQLAARKLFAERAKAGTLKKSPTRKSQATGKKPTKRLVARRMSIEKVPKGYFANPTQAQRNRPKWVVYYPTGKVFHIAMTRQSALAIAKEQGDKFYVEDGDTGKRLSNPIEKRGAKDVKKWYARRADNKETFLGQGIRVYEFACATQAHAEKLARELANQFNVSYVVEYK